MKQPRYLLSSLKTLASMSWRESAGNNFGVADSRFEDVENSMKSNTWAWDLPNNACG